MTPPNKRRFQSIRVVSIDSTTKMEHTDLNPALMSAADLEKICKSLDSIRATIMLEFAHRTGYVRQKPVLWVEPTTGSSKFKQAKEVKINFKELEELAAEL